VQPQAPLVMGPPNPPPTDVGFATAGDREKLNHRRRGLGLFPGSFRDFLSRGKPLVLATCRGLLCSASTLVSGPDAEKSTGLILK
jgi:hypothetical protein